MQYADRESVIKHARKRQVINVCLNDMHIFQFAGCGKGRFYRGA